MSDDLVYKFKRSGDLNDTLTEILASPEICQHLEVLKASVEAMVKSDLELNSGLLASLEKSQKGTVDQRKVSLMFERRIRSEVESGLAGTPIDEYISTNHDRILTLVKSKIVGASGK